MKNAVLRRWRAIAIVVFAAILVAGGFAIAGRAAVAPDVPTTDVTAGDFVDYMQLRGSIRPAKSIILSAPTQAGELQIVKLAKNGSAVASGDVLVEFDATMLRQRMQEKQSELKQAAAEIDQAKAQQKITEEQDQSAVMKAKYDLERARLDLGKRDLVSKLEYEQAKLAVADAELKLHESEEKARSNRTAAEADLAAKLRKREKAQFDFDRAKRGIDALIIKAPTGGTVNIMPNYRASSMFGAEVEFREGDRAWPGANIVELPDLSSIHLEARLDESDRGRLKVGQSATVKIEAVPGRDFAATVDLISVLAKADFTSGWPPLKNFDLGLVLKDPDPRIRPGMTATARIATDRVPGFLLAPTEAVFQRDGRSVVYKLRGSMFDETHNEVARRGREQVAIAAGVQSGYKLATRRPETDQIRRQP
ncbi:MAG: HlyD family efflux transporter periplasmic adaptor subunit [Acidobacteria bacterium]|nr:HlyD family efflux transporter periplasmic adaptor subunit [Acidobacteriota bacterium]